MGTEHLVHVRNKDATNDNMMFLDHDANDMTTFDFFKKQQLGPSAISRGYYNDIYGIIEGVNLGLGQAIVSRHLIGGNDNIHIVEHPIAVSNPVVLHYHASRFHTRLHRAVIRHLQQNLGGFLH